MSEENDAPADWHDRWPRERRIKFVLGLPDKYIDSTFEALMEEEFMK